MKLVNIFILFNLKMIERVSSDLENINFHLKLKVFMTMLGHISDLLLLLIIELSIC